MDRTAKNSINYICAKATVAAKDRIYLRILVLIACGNDVKPKKGAQKMEKKQQTLSVNKTIVYVVTEN